METPTAVKVIGGVWIGFGALAVLSSLLAGFAYQAAGGMDANATDGPIGVVFSYFPWLVVFQLFFGGFGIVAALELLRMRRWARAAVEGLTWTTIVLFLANQALVWSEIASMGAATGEAGLILVATGLFGTAAFVVPCVFIVRTLRSRRIRRAFDVAV